MNLLTFKNLLLFSIIIIIILIIYLFKLNNEKYKYSRQSPIDIKPTGYILKNDNLLDIIYKNAKIPFIKSKLSHHNYHFDINDSNFITKYNNTEFILKQFHFHNTSEHKLNGKKFDMEVHLVHKALAQDTNQYLVIGFFIESNPDLLKDGIFDSAIKQEDNGIIDLTKDLDLFKNRFYNYKGSLTTSPYSPNVEWIVFNKPIYTKLSKKEITNKWNNLASARDILDTVYKSEVLTFE